MTLTAAKRLDLKKQIAKTLSRQSWSDIDLTLNEFKIDTPNEYGSDKESWIAGVLRWVTDDQMLAQLALYLTPAKAPTTPVDHEKAFENVSDPWTGDRFRLFISHIHQNAEEAGSLRTELAKRSIDAFVAHDSITATEEWVRVIEYALRSCHACAAMLTPGFKESDWTDQEIGACMARDLLIIPLEYGLIPYGFLARYQALPITGRLPSDVALSIFELLAQKEQSRDAMARALVARWAATTSFDVARVNYAYLRKIPEEAWTQALVTEVWEARSQNGDLKNASIDWQASEVALEALFRDLPFSRPDEE